MMNSSPIVLITGATSGIGASLFHLYVAQGYRVIACGRDAAKLSLIASKAYKTLAFDVTQKQQVIDAFEEIEHVDLLILNAGDCLYIDDAKQFNSEAFESIINTNLLSLGYVLASLLPKVGTGGQVVFISSSATILPFPRAEAYGASKAGVDYLANSLRLDLRKHGIGVTLVHPGFVRTQLTDKNDFNMPFMLSSEQAATRIYQGVDQRKTYLHFPKRLTVLMKVIALLPQAFWHLLLRKEIKT